MAALVFERNFLNEVITDFDKVLTFLQPGNFGKQYSAPLIFKTSVSQVTTFTITLEVLALIRYYSEFKQQYPEDPTPEQVARLNVIRTAMNLPPI